MKERYKSFIITLGKKNQNFFTCKDYGKLFSLRAFVFVYCFFSFFTMKTEAVKEVHLLWKISRSGIESSYLIGIKHDLCLNQKSLPPEVNRALEKSKVGLIELNFSELTKEDEGIISGISFKLPEGQTLLSHMSEENVRKVFEVMHTTLSENDKIGYFKEVLKKKKDIDITSYENFIRLTPFTVYALFRGILSYGTYDEPYKKIMLEDLRNSSIKKEEKVEKAVVEVAAKEKCPLKKGYMDHYLEKKIFCEGKPVHSIETAESQISDVLSTTDHEFETEQLLLAVDAFILDRKELTSELDIIVSDFNRYVLEWKGYLVDRVQDRIFQKTEIEASSVPQQRVVRFLENKNCKDFSEASIHQLKEQFVLYAEKYMNYILQKEPMDEEQEQQFIQLTGEINLLKEDIISSCFPDYVWPDSAKKLIKRKVWLNVQALKQEKKKFFISRDKKLALSMIPFLQGGEAFVALGLGHLTGVIGELQEQGWEIEPIELSRLLEPDLESANCKVYDNDNSGDLQPILAPLPEERSVKTDDPKEEKRSLLNDVMVWIGRLF